ncbi:hypothetical protein [Amorphus sp. 3PC139-8]|uniref:hypothetical protein n=1 Tax=Amorphus sp. 3PC139-8 TaxID=2735676 RepID=UPI00345DA799
MTRSFAAAGLALILMAPVAPAIAQSDVTATGPAQITVTPRGYNYPGPYGPNLPGVYMLTNSGLPIGPDIDSGKLKTPNLELPVNAGSYDQPTGPISGWNGTYGGGIPF